MAQGVILPASVGVGRDMLATGSHG